MRRIQLPREELGRIEQLRDAVGDVNGNIEQRRRMLRHLLRPSWLRGMAGQRRQWRGHLVHIH
jgi:hypothetical protein